MTVLGRGVRNAFRNGIRTFSIVVILGLSIAMALAMLLARDAVKTKISSVEGSIGNTITITPAGFRGAQGGGGEPLTSAELDKVAGTPHVVGMTKSLQDRLSSTDTNLQSSIDPGTLGRRFQRNGNAANGANGANGTNGAGGLGGFFGGGQNGQNGQAGAGGTFTLPVTVLGTTDPSTLAAAGSGKVSLTSGTAFPADSNDNVAVLGAALATKNNLAVGGTFTAYGTTMTVSGIYTSGTTFGDGSVVMPLATLQRLSGETDAVTDVTVQVDSITNLDTTEAAIKSSLGTNADVVSQQDTSSNALGPLDNIKSISSFSLAGAVIAGVAIIFLTMLMIVRERRREIAVLKAIGAPNRKVVSQFVWEALTFTAFAAIVGVAGGVVGGNPITRLLVNSNTNTATNQAAGPFGGAVGGGGAGAAGGAGRRALGQAGQGLARVARRAGTLNLSNVHASVGWSTLGYGLLAAIVIAVVGSSIPAYLISRVRPAEVLRGD